MKKIIKQMQHKLQKKDGFTLVELIVVLVIMGILTTAIIPTVTGYVGEAKVKVSDSNEYMVEQAALLYLTDWEIDGNDASDISNDFDVQDLVDAGYLSNSGDLGKKIIKYTKLDNGRYSISLSDPEENTNAQS